MANDNDDEAKELEPIKPKTNRFSANKSYVSSPLTSSSYNGNVADKNQFQHSAVFPKSYGHCGWLDVRTIAEKPWKRRYFVVNNNFLLCATTPHAKALESVLPLDGCKFQSTKKSSDMTFELFIRKQIFYFRAPSPQQCTKWTKSIQKASKLKIKDIYRFLHTLGSGTSGETKVVAAKHRTTNEDSAIKIMDKRLCNKKTLKTEIQLLKTLDCPQIVQLYDLIETKRYLYIVMEKCAGGELFDQIAELDGSTFSEEDSCTILHQIAEAVRYMHGKNMVHRDLKPENVLCVVPNSIQKVKLADFGISKMLKKLDHSMVTSVGTVSYSAPEVLANKAYDYTVDFWSIGVIMYILFCGYPPFCGDNDEEVEYAILNEEIIYEDEDWEHVSADAKDLCKGLLHRKASKRKTCDDILKLTWKLSSGSVSFKKSLRNFKQHVLEKKLRRHTTMSADQNDHSMSRKVYIKKRSSKKKQNDEMKVTSFDDMHQSKQQKEIKNAQKHDKMIKAFRGHSAVQSKGTEELLELQKNAHLFAIHEEDGNEDDDEKNGVFDKDLMIEIISKEQFEKSDFKKMAEMIGRKGGRSVLNEMLNDRQIIKWRLNDDNFNEYCDHFTMYKAWSRLFDRDKEKWNYIKEWIQKL